MKFPLSKREYEFLQEVAEKDGLTVDQEAQIAVLSFLKAHDAELLEQAKKGADPEVLRVFEKS